MLAIGNSGPIKAQIASRLPAALHREMINRAGANPVGLKAGPGLRCGRGHILGGLR